MKQELIGDGDWVYFNMVEAHRSYLLAMSKYKHLRYLSKKRDKSSKAWYNVDQAFISVIEKYNREELKVIEEEEFMEKEKKDDAFYHGIPG